MLMWSSFHGELFARTADGGQRICDPKGLFKCEGKQKMVQQGGVNIFQIPFLAPEYTPY